MENGLPNLQRLLKEERRQNRSRKGVPAKKKSNRMLELQKERENILPSSQEDEINYDDDEDYDDGDGDGDDGDRNTKGSKITGKDSSRRYDNGDDDNDDQVEAEWEESQPYSQGKAIPFGSHTPRSNLAAKDSSKEDAMYSSASVGIFDEDDW